MKNLLFTLIILTNLFAANVYIIDITSSTIKWTGRKITGEHYGTINFKSGIIHANNKQVNSGQIIIDMQSIKNLDIQNATYRGYLENHLKSDDFFNVELFPESNLQILKLINKDEIDNQLNPISYFLCELTIKGIAHEIEIPVKIKVYNNYATAIGGVDVDRSLYDVQYNSKSFFPNIGDKLIYNNFTLNFNIIARRSWKN